MYSTHNETQRRDNSLKKGEELASSLRREQDAEGFIELVYLSIWIKSVELVVEAFISLARSARTSETKEPTSQADYIESRAPEPRQSVNPGRSTIRLRYLGHP